MHYFIKAGMLKILSLFPQPEKINYLFQKRITRSLPSSLQFLLNRVNIAKRHFDNFQNHCKTAEASDAVFFEFGAGWDLIIPVTYYCLNVNRQIVIDIRRNLRMELVKNTLSRFKKHESQIGNILNRELRMSFMKINSVSDLQKYFGIKYIAPYDVRNTQFPNDSFDFISNSATFQYIPENDIINVLRECFRILKPNGIMSCAISLEDNYVRFDKSITNYNFFRFSDRAWRKFNSTLLYQNRLIAKDFLNIVNRSGFKILDKTLSYPNDIDKENLRRLPLAEKYKKYSLEELGVKSLWIVLQKQNIEVKKKHSCTDNV